MLIIAERWIRMNSRESSFASISVNDERCRISEAGDLEMVVGVDPQDGLRFDDRWCLMGDGPAALFS